jgi:integrase
MNSNKKIMDCFEEYIGDCMYSKRLRPKTIESYNDVIKNFLATVPEVIGLEELTANSVAVFFRRIGKRKQKNKIGVRGSTVRTYYSKLVVFFRWLEQNGYKEEGSIADKIIKPPVPTYEDDRALKEHQVSKIITAIIQSCTDNTFLFKRDLIIVYILLYTGIRKGELLGLRVGDIDFTAKSLFINGETSKSKKGRKIPIHPTLFLHLIDYLRERKKRKVKCEYLIISNNRDGKLTEHGIKHWVEKYKKLSKVNFHLHRFRHTFACTMAKSHADITSIKNVLGHSSILMTERYLRSYGTENSRGFINKMSY